MNLKELEKEIHGMSNLDHARMLYGVIGMLEISEEKNEPVTVDQFIKCVMQNKKWILEDRNEYVSSSNMGRESN